jgi:hypothetical protein
MHGTTYNQEDEQLSASVGRIILEQLPERIRTAILARAAEIDYPVEAIVEMANTRWSEANAGYLDFTRYRGVS